MSDEFKWDAAVIGRSLVFPSADGVAVYRNADGDAVIRQQGRMGDDDSFVIVPECYVEELIAALRREFSRGRE